MSDGAPSASIPNPPVVVPARTDIKGYVPAVETAVHRAMFQYYLNMGKDRSLTKVAKQFGKSPSFLANLSRAFQWQDRVLTFEQEIKDPVVTETRDKVDDSRRKLVDVVHDITDTLHQMMVLSKRIKNSGSEPNEVDKANSRMLIAALQVFGLRIEKPSGLKALVAVLRDIVQFNVESQPSVGKDLSKGPYIGNVEKMALVIKDD